MIIRKRFHRNETKLKVMRNEGRRRQHQNYSFLIDLNVHIWSGAFDVGRRHRHRRRTSLFFFLFLFYDFPLDVYLAVLNLPKPPPAQRANIPNKVQVIKMQALSGAYSTSNLCALIFNYRSSDYSFANARKRKKG